MSSWRSNFPVGSPRWATRRAQWTALGYEGDELQRPKIAVVNSSSKLSPCFSHLDEIAEHISARIRQGGALGFEIRTVAPTDFMMAAGSGGGYVLSSRDLLTNDIEAVVEGAQLDGMICLASCDKTTPGQLMAAGRLNVPTVIVPCGYHASGTKDPSEPQDIEEVFIKAGHVAQGRCTVQQLRDMSDGAILSPGVCTGMGTANTMHIVAEALGMSVTGSAPVAANSPRMWEKVDEAVEAVLTCVQNDIFPRQILTEAAFSNAAAAVLAVGGSINSIKHLQATAAEAGLDLDVGELHRELSAQVRPLAAVRPNGLHSIEQFDEAGGAAGVLQQLGALVERSAETVTGRTMGENLDHAPAPDQEIIRPLTSPFAEHSLIQIVRGNLAPSGGIVKLSTHERRELRLEGPAVVFEDPAEAIRAVDQGRVVSGDVLVLRGLGVRGTPGMGMASNTVFAVDGAGLTGEVAVVTDGQLSGLVNKGIVVGEVKPEGLPASPLGCVREGDRIHIDVRAGTIELLVTDQELESRMENAEVLQRRASAGAWLKTYAAGVTPLEEGAVLNST